MNTEMQAPIDRIHEAIKGFSDTIKESGLPPQLPEEVYRPAGVFDLAVHQARQFYPSVRFIRDEEIDAFLTIAHDPKAVS